MGRGAIKLILSKSMLGFRAAEEATRGKIGRKPKGLTVSPFAFKEAGMGKRRNSDRKIVVDLHGF